MNEECPICYELINIQDADEGLICFTCNNIYCKNCCRSEYIVEKNLCAICNRALKLEDDDELFSLINITLEKKPEEYLHMAIVYTKIAGRYFNYNFKYAVELYKQAHELGLEVPYTRIANQYFKIKDYDNAILWYLVTPNNSEACYKLGISYSILGQPEIANKWLKQASYLGDYCSIGYLGYSFQKINHLDKARYWYELGVEFDDIPSINNLAILYKTGQGVTKDNSMTIKLLKKASKLGSPEAMYNLALTYKEKGWYRSYRIWLRKSSNLGYQKAIDILQN